MRPPSDPRSTMPDTAPIHDEAHRPDTAVSLWERWLHHVEERYRLRHDADPTLWKRAADAACAVALQASALRARVSDDLRPKAIYAAFYRQNADADGTHLLALIERAIELDNRALQGPPWSEIMSAD